jgi:hypothetical protein
MAKSRAVYEPGELDRVRKNIGDIEPDEARRIAGLLGGEVGYEKDREAIEKEERRLKIARAADEARKAAKEARTLERKRHIEALRRLTKNGEEGGTASRPMGYSARVRVDFLCSHGDHLIKTQTQALRSLISFLPGYKDSINPYFVSTLCSEVFDRIDKIVQAARFIFPSKQAELWARLRDYPAQYAVMDGLVNWNIDGVSGVLSVLQGKPREIQLENMRSLVVLVVKPLFRLKEAFEGSLFKTSLATASSIASDITPENRKRYMDAREEAIEEADFVYANLLYRWYPLIMKFCASSFHEYPNFYDDCRPGILRFLGLKESDIVREPPPERFEDRKAEKPAEEAKPAEAAGDQAAQAEAPAVDAQPPLDPPPPESPMMVPPPDLVPEEVPPVMESKIADIPAPVLIGIELMDRLFPESGWKTPQRWPDLYPQFNHIYSLPRGSDLIAPTDPLIQIIVLCQVLNDTLHGFRSMKFGLSQNAMSIDLNVAINDILNEWSLPVDEVLAKAYLPLLSEYCRLIETERESQNSAYVAKREADLIWYKKRYFLPHLKGNALSGIQSPRDRDIKALFKQCQLLKGYISEIAQDIDRAVRARQELASGGESVPSLSCVTVRNPFDLAVFEVENLVSRRLRLLLKHEGPKPKRLTNAALIYYAFSILQVLDYMLNNPQSWAYSGKFGLPYRSLESGGNKKGIVDIDPEKAFLRQIDGFIKRKEREAQEKGPTA